MASVSHAVCRPPRRCLGAGRRDDLGRPGDAPGGRSVPAQAAGRAEIYRGDRRCSPAGSRPVRADDLGWCGSGRACG